MSRQQRYKQLAVYAISNIQGQCVFSLFAKSTMYAVTYEFGSCWLIKVCFWFSKVQCFWHESPKLSLFCCHTSSLCFHRLASLVRVPMPEPRWMLLWLVAHSLYVSISTHPLGMHSHEHVQHRSLTIICSSSDHSSDSGGPGIMRLLAAMGDSGNWETLLSVATPQNNGTFQIVTFTLSARTISWLLVR